jgi:hypothetical protein
MGIRVPRRRKPKRPADPVLHGGYACPKVNYCPESTGTELPCPAGTYRDETLGASTEDCKQCKKDTYNNLKGQQGCFPIGATAEASAGANIGDCIGEKRTYCKKDGTCRCIPGYEFFPDGIDEDKTDSIEACV